MASTAQQEIAAEVYCALLSKFVPPGVPVSSALIAVSEIRAALATEAVAAADQIIELAPTPAP